MSFLNYPSLIERIHTDLGESVNSIAVSTYYDLLHGDVLEAEVGYGYSSPSTETTTQGTKKYRSLDRGQTWTFIYEREVKETYIRKVDTV